MIPSPKPKKWGPVLATRKSSRNHGYVNTLDKAQAYLRKKNLEVPHTFKGNSFASLFPDYPSSVATTVSVNLGTSDRDRRQTIQNLVDQELIDFHNFASNNPEIALPADIEITSDDMFNNVDCDNHNDVYSDGPWVTVSRRNRGLKVVSDFDKSVEMIGYIRNVRNGQNWSGYTDC